MTPDDEPKPKKIHNNIPPLPEYFYIEGPDEFVKGEPETDLSGIQFESERLESGNKELREKYDAVVEALKELIPIAERMQSACASGETFDYSNEHDFRDSQEYQSAIDRAKSLLP